MLKLMPLFGNGAVLCRRKELRVFGQADKGVRVSGCIKAADGTVLSSAECITQEASFLLRFPPLEQQVNCTLTVTDGVDTIVSTDISIGEVFLASGQSNMELELQNANEGQTLIPVHDDLLVHYFNVPKKSVWNDDAIQAEGWSHWERVRPDFAKDMSAVAYFFARKLAKTIDCPVGIIDCYWGGTSVTCWIDREGLERTAEGQRYIANFIAQGGDKPFDQWQQEEDAFQKEMADWNGKVDAIKKERPDITWPEINETVGLCPWHPPVGPGSPYRPGGLVETMTKRVVPATLTGILFYQGEDDTCKTDCYDVLLSSMVLRLRELFRDDTLPFLNVQLPMWIAANDVDKHDWARLRHAQAKVADQLQPGGMAVLLDCGEWDNIHPTDKRTPGERLCDVALRVIYGMDAPESPRALSKHTSGSNLVITLSQPVVRRPEGELLLEIAGEDGVYAPVNDLRLEGNTMILHSAAVLRPVMARYAHVNWGKVCLFGENGLPLAPFILEA